MKSFRLAACCLSFVVLLSVSVSAFEGGFVKDGVLYDELGPVIPPPVPDPPELPVPDPGDSLPPLPEAEFSPDPDSTVPVDTQEKVDRFQGVGSSGRPIHVTLTPESVVNSDVSDSTVDDVPMVASISPVTPADTTGLKKALLELIGNYDPIVQIEIHNGKEYRSMYPDHVWLCSAAIVALFIYCLFRLLGVVLCKK